MEFKIGDHVVHPQFGLGHVVILSEREFTPGVKKMYYEIAIFDGSIIWVAEDLSISGVRRLAKRTALANCRKILEARPSPLTVDARYRQSEQATRLRQGTIQTQCEVVRDLFAYGEHKSLYGTIGVFFKAVRNVLCQEWSVVQGTTLAEAEGEIGLLLEKSSATLKSSNN